MDNIKEWTSLPIPELISRACCRKDRKRISTGSSLMSPALPPDDVIGQGTELKIFQHMFTTNASTARYTYVLHKKTVIISIMHFDIRLFPVQN